MKGTRRTSQETGAEGEIELIITISSSPIVKELVRVFRARVKRIGKAKPDDGEFIEAREFTIEECVNMRKNGKIKDAATIIAIQLEVIMRNQLM